MPLIETIGAGLIGAAGAQVFTWMRERRRNRDAYRAPQREAIGAIVASVNNLKVSMMDALENLGAGGRQTSDDSAVRAITDFQHALLAVDEKFQIGRLAIVDGPCRDKMLAAYLRYSELRDFANNLLEPTSPSFGEFMRRLGDTAGAIDALVGELVDLAEVRLSPSRAMFSRRSSLNVASKGALSQGEQGGRPPSTDN